MFCVLQMSTPVLLIVMRDLGKEGTRYRSSRWHYKSVCGQGDKCLLPSIREGQVRDTRTFSGGGAGPCSCQPPEDLCWGRMPPDSKTAHHYSSFTRVAPRKLNVISQPVLGALTTASQGSVLRVGDDVLAAGDLCTRPRQARVCSQAAST